MIPVILFLLSIGLQLAAAVSALLLIRITGRRLAWIFLSLAMVLMSWRRIVSFVSFLIDGRTITFDLPEVIALIISVLMFAGVLRIRTYFRSILTTEKECKQLEEALRVQNRRFEAFFENTITPLVFLDKDFNFIRVNKAYADTGKREISEFPGHNHFEFYPSDAKTIFAEVVRTKTAFQTFARPFIYADHPEWGVTYWNWTLVPILDNKGEVEFLAFSLVDVTEHRKLEDQLRHMQKMDSIGQLAGGIAHDFNNILTAIVGYGHIALMKMAPSSSERLNIEHMLKAADRAAHLTQNLLIFSRKQIMDRKPVDLNGIIRMVEKLLLMIIGEDINVETILHEGAVDVFADSGQIEQVLMNLATNARDAMPECGTFTIATEVIELDDEFVKIHGYGKPGAYALMTVTDTGTGMDEATRERIFEPFFTTKEFGKGTGLGLSIVYGIIKQHDGYINCYSELDKGTAFRIYLPVFKTAVKEAKSAETAGIPPARGTETILLAEDEESVRRLIRDVLKESGYKVIEAFDGEEAVNKFMENKDTVDLLLLDVVMPKMSGKEAYEIIKKVKPEIKLLMTSGYSADFISKKGMLEEGLNFLAKPMSPANLLKKVREALDK